MGNKNTTAVGRGAVLAKEKLVIRKSPVLTVAQLENGNRLMRRIAAKQVKRSSKKGGK